jgi:hypothetical protein
MRFRGDSEGTSRETHSPCGKTLARVGKPARRQSKETHMARREYPGVYPCPAAGGRTLYRAFYTDSIGTPRQKRGFGCLSAADLCRAFRGCRL